MSDTPVPFKRRRWRFQFGLRTFLIGSTLASLVLAWGLSFWFAPKPDETKLAGGLVLRREGERFSVIDQHGRRLTRGQFRNERAVGNWTYYHLDGRVALAGKCDEDNRVGVWTAWNPRGGKVSTISHGMTLETVVYTDFAPPHGRFLEHSNRSQSLPTKAAGFTMLWSGSLESQHTISLSNREGKTQLWHRSGRLATTGSCHCGRRDGEWTFWDEQGRVTAQGLYRNGLRVGKWQVQFASDSEPHSVWYAAGMEVHDLPGLLAKLKLELESNDLERQCAALDTLAELGGEGGSLFPAALASDNQRVVVHALRAAARVFPIAREALPEIRRLTESPDSNTRIEALFALAALDDDGGAAIARLLSYSLTCAPDERADIRARIGRLGEASLSTLSEAIDGVDPALRLAALDVLAFMVWPSDYSYRGWRPAGLDTPSFRARLEKVLQHARDSADPKISAPARELLDALLDNALPPSLGLGGGMGGLGG